MTEASNSTLSAETASNDWKNTRVPNHEVPINVTIPAGATVAMVDGSALSLKTDAIVIARIIEGKVFVEVNGVSAGIRESGDTLELAVSNFFKKLNTDSVNLQTKATLNNTQTTFLAQLMRLFECVI